MYKLEDKNDQSRVVLSCFDSQNADLSNNSEYLTIPKKDAEVKCLYLSKSNLGQNSISGKFYEDRKANGQMDGDDDYYKVMGGNQSYYGQLPATLYDQNWQKIAVNNTPNKSPYYSTPNENEFYQPSQVQENGHYKFENLPDGQYNLCTNYNWNYLYSIKPGVNFAENLGLPAGVSVVVSNKPFDYFYGGKKAPDSSYYYCYQINLNGQPVSGLDFAFRDYYGDYQNSSSSSSVQSSFSSYSQESSILNSQSSTSDYSSSSLFSNYSSSESSSGISSSNSSSSFYSSKGNSSSQYSSTQNSETSSNSAFSSSSDQQNNSQISSINSSNVLSSIQPSSQNNSQNESSSLQNNNLTQTTTSTQNQNPTIQNFQDLSNQSEVNNFSSQSNSSKLSQSYSSYNTSSNISFKNENFSNSKSEGEVLGVSEISDKNKQNWFSWWWLIFVLMLAIVGYFIYKNRFDKQ